MPPNDLIPFPYQDGARRMAEAIRGINDVIVASHVNLDGDAVGSLAAAGHILHLLGKKFMLYSGTGLPQSFSFLSLPDIVHTSLERPPLLPRSALLLDCNEPHRLGQELAARMSGLAGVNIDHHPGRGMGSRANWIFPRAAATAQLMAYVAACLGLPLSGGVADAVAVGIITDTGGFRHGNTDADALQLMVHLTKNGCNIFRLRELLENTWTLGRMRLWAKLMSSARLERDNTVAFCRVMSDDLLEHQCAKEDVEGFVEHLRRLRGVKVAALLLEDSRQTCKFSLRSAEGSDVLAAASALGGGGHVNAAGGTLRLAPGRAESVLLDAVCKQLDRENQPALSRADALPAGE
ncbi:MAG: DHH family phosphoesterase [Desulfovibrio sp.]|jgi:phosphoesterase RecJ-like protein|nr:DHH family phosphoesterase [Desulfovibrio sp.]